MSEAVEEKEEVIVEEIKEEEVVEQEPEKQVVAKEEAPPKKEDMSEDELEAYSKSVQKRIKKLTEKYRHEEKDKEEAVALSKRLMEENKKLQNRVKTLDTGYVSEYGTRLQSQSEQAKKLYTDAFAAGDADKMAEAQQAMAQIAVEQQNFNTAKLRVEQQAKVQPQQAAQQAAQQVAQQPKQQPKPDPRAEQWASENEWFGQDKVMTTAVFTIHNQLTQEEGFDVNTEEYYTAVDSRMRTEFPHKFQPTTARKTGGVQVASAGNSASRNKQGRRTVKLTPSQVSIAKKLGVPLEEYAKHVKE
jgi:hypothetical protein